MRTKPEWFTNPEHAHVVGLDEQLMAKLRMEFADDDITVDCGVEGRGPFTYHFMIGNVAVEMHGHVTSRAIDLLSEWFSYRFEVCCL